MTRMLATLPLASAADGEAPIAHPAVHVGAGTESGWPILRFTDDHALLVVRDESTAHAVSRLLNMIATVLTHGMLRDDRLAFIIGIDAMHAVETAMQALGITLTID